MRVLITICVMILMTVTVVAEEPHTRTEVQRVEAYHQAIAAGDFEAARMQIQLLSKQFPNSAITKVVQEHWKLQNKSSHSNELTEPDSSSSENSKSNPASESPLISVVYNVPDLLVPVGNNNEQRAHLRNNAKALIELIEETCQAEHEQAKAVFYESNLSLVMRGTESAHQKCQQILSAIRRQMDYQIVFETRLISIEPELANLFALREVISRHVLDQRLERLNQSPRTNILLSPKVTLFDDQKAQVETSDQNGGIAIELHGKTSDDKRLVRAEIDFKVTGKAAAERFQFSTSELIPHGKTAVFFIQTEGTTNPLFDRRLLQEAGVAVANSKQHQLFLTVTPRIIVQEEEELLLGGAEKETDKNKASFAYPYAWPSYGTYPTSPYPQVPRAWTPAKLEWDDGHWNLDFSNTKALPANHPWNLNWPAESIRLWEIERKIETPKPVER